MCKFWSCVLTREGKVLWNKEYNSHEQLINDGKLNDTKLKDRDFVRIEITPKNIFSKKRTDWAYKVDEPETIPCWYEEDLRHFESLVWKEWKKAMSETLWKLNLNAVEEVIQEVKRIDYFDMHGEPDPEWNLTLAPSLDAAWAAARAAAGDAAGVAARDAAGVAAWAAAWDAAMAAAGAAARAAAWDAALLACIRLSSSIDQKHIDHANARMEVWKRGYALYCEMHGKLYVYGVKK